MKKHLLLLHGALGTKDQFASLKKYLDDHFILHDLNFDGHGDKPFTKPYSIDLFAGNVMEYLTSSKLEHVDIFGYSMGGYVALKVAQQAPHLVGQVVTLGTKFDWTRESAEKEIKMLNPEKIEEKVPAFAKQLAAIHEANDWKAVMRETAAMMMELGSGKMLTHEDLAGIANQTLITVGSRDVMVSVEESATASRFLTNGTLQVIDDFEHAIQKNDPKKLADVIANYLIN